VPRGALPPFDGFHGRRRRAAEQGLLPRALVLPRALMLAGARPGEDCDRIAATRKQTTNYG
jgi:hypothetical protein